MSFGDGIVRLSPVMRFTLPNRRKVEMVDLHILPTRYDWLAASQREHQSSILPGLVRQLYSDFYPDKEVPFAIVWPVGETILQTTCIASFTSDPMGQASAGEGYSYLVAVWFVPYVERSVANIVCEGLSRLDWEGNALDYSWW